MLNIISTPPTVLIQFPALHLIGNNYLDSCSVLCFLFFSPLWWYQQLLQQGMENHLLSPSSLQKKKESIFFFSVMGKAKLPISISIAYQGADRSLDAYYRNWIKLSRSCSQKYPRSLQVNLVVCKWCFSSQKLKQRIQWFPTSWFCHKTHQWLHLMSFLSLVLWIVQKKAVKAQHWYFFFSFFAAQNLCLPSARHPSCSW